MDAIPFIMYGNFKFENEGEIYTILVNLKHSTMCNLVDLNLDGLDTNYINLFDIFPKETQSILVKVDTKI